MVSFSGEDLGVVGIGRLTRQVSGITQNQLTVQHGHSAGAIPCQGRHSSFSRTCF